MTPRRCAFVLRSVCQIGEGSRENETVLWSLCKKGNVTAVLLPWSTAHLYVLTHMLCDTHVHSQNVDPISYPAYYLYQSLWPSAQGTIIPGHSVFGMLVTLALVGVGGVGGLLLGSGPQRLHCPDAAGFPRLPLLQPEGTPRSHF